MSFDDFTNGLKLADRPWTRDIFCKIWRDRYVWPRIDVSHPTEGCAELLAEVLSFNNVSWEAVEWFDFGDPSEDIFHNQIEPLKEIIKNNLFSMPYEQCFFRTSAKDQKQRKAQILICIQKMQKEDGCICIIFALYEDNKSNFYATAQDFFTLKANEKGVQIGKYNKENTEDAGARLFLCLWMILNTRNIPKTVERRNKHEDRKREQKGLPRIGGITHIGTRAYETALRETQNMERTGTHASPRPHLRRGHIRTYEDGKKIWVHATIVNGSDQTKIVAREKYAVRTGNVDGA